MSDNTTKRFTFDPEKDGEEMPTLTSLIYGKKPNQNSQASGGDAFTLEPTRALDRNALLSELAKLPTPAGGPASALPPSTPENADAVLNEFFGDSKAAPAGSPRPSANLTRPSNWKSEVNDEMIACEPNQLESLNSPYSPMLSFLFQLNKIESAIVFEPTKFTDGAFASINAVHPKKFSDLWMGMQFHPEAFAELWGRLQKFGYTEYSPVGLASQAQSVDRTAMRIAFGLESKQWLTLVLQPKVTGNQLVAIVSPNSIAASLPSALDKAVPAPPPGKAPPAPPRSRAA
jgi:hypothetical protein